MRQNFVAARRYKACARIDTLKLNQVFCQLLDVINKKIFTSVVVSSPTFAAKLTILGAMIAAERGFKLSDIRKKIEKTLMSIEFGGQLCVGEIRVSPEDETPEINQKSQLVDAAYVSVKVEAQEVNKKFQPKEFSFCVRNDVLSKCFSFSALFFGLVKLGGSAEEPIDVLALAAMMLVLFAVYKGAASLLKSCSKPRRTGLFSRADFDTSDLDLDPELQCALLESP